MESDVDNKPTEQIGTYGVMMRMAEHLCQSEWVLSTRENQATENPGLLIPG